MGINRARLPGVCYIYMNHFIKKPGCGEPPIVVDRGGERVVYCNEVRIVNDKQQVLARVVFDPDGLDAPYHIPRVWIETAYNVEAK